LGGREKERGPIVSMRTDIVARGTKSPNRIEIKSAYFIINPNLKDSS